MHFKTLKMPLVMRIQGRHRSVSVSVQEMWVMLTSTFSSSLLRFYKGESDLTSQTQRDETGDGPGGNRHGVRRTLR